jgi:glyoxylase-like metal-dependent hydrolase (beta-lactamase superfamily II)
MIIIQLEMEPLDNFSYIVGCQETHKAMVIDPGPDVQRIIREAGNARLGIETVVNTHGHGDHTAGNHRLKELTGARIIIHSLDRDGYERADLILTDEQPIRVGGIEFQVYHTPGHTPGGICLHAQSNLFTGDTLFVGDSGRTDLAGGDRPALGASIRRLMQLPDHTVVWPGHDYGPTPSSTIGWEKRHNINAKEYGYYADG